MGGLLRHPRIEPLVSTLLRARLVRESARFAARELAGRRTVGRYRLRRGPARVVLRHRSPDVLALDEVFYQGIYDPPPGAAEALRALGPALTAVDLGSNIGLFGARLLAEHPQARITGFEPDPANVAVLERTIAANDTAGRWGVLRACAGPADGTVRFIAGEYATSHVAAADEPGGEEIACLDALPHLAEADLAKIDIEGSEWALLADPRFGVGAKPRVVVMEYHPHGCPGDDPRRTAEERLRALGYEVTAPPYRGPAGHGMLWAWRP